MLFFVNHLFLFIHAISFMRIVTSHSVIENFIVGLVTSAVTAIFVWLWTKFRRSQILNRKAAFFGIFPQDPCLVVMSRHPESEDKMSHGDVETLIEIVRLVDEIGGKLNIAPFNQILAPAGEVTEFCIGGSYSNLRTKVHLDNFLKGVQFYPYSPNDLNNRAIIVKDEKLKYRKNEDEYAILSRFYPYPNSHPVILISGQTPRANQAAVHYLVQNYDGVLRKQFGNRKNFCLIVKLQSPSTYGYRSVKVMKDITSVAFH